MLLSVVCSVCLGLNALWLVSTEQYGTVRNYVRSFPVAQMVEHGISNAKIMGSIPRESKSW